jgi:hypothetical protein
MARRGEKFDQGWDNFQRWLRDLGRGGFRRAADRPLWNATQKIAALVRSRYRDLDADRAGTFGYKAARAGKEPGATPARLPMDPSFIGMELYAKHVLTERRGGYSRVYLSETAVHPTRGLPLTVLAAQMENPVPIILPGSFRAFVYWMLIVDGRGGWGTRKRDSRVPDIPWKEDKLITPEPKEVWKFVARKLLGPQIMRMVWPDLRQRLKRFAAAYGAQV